MSLIMIWSLVVTVLLTRASGTTVAGPLGTQFVFSLPDHLDRSSDGLYLLIESRFEHSTIYIEASHLGTSYSRSILKGVTKIPLNQSLIETNTGISNNCVHLTSGTPISVHVIDHVDSSADGALILPVFSGQSEYFTVSYTPNDGKSEITVSTLYEGTDVYIELKTPSGKVNFNGRSFSNGETIHVTLKRLGSLQLQHDFDLTGTRVTSNNPISVLSGDSCVEINHGACDHIMDQVPPVSTWGSNYILTQLQTMPSVTFRVVAARYNTHVTIGSTDTHTLNIGDFLDKRLAQTDAIVIQSTEPVMVVQFSEGLSGGQGDPAMAVVPSLNNFPNGYVFYTPDGFSSHHVTVTIETTLVPGLRLNGQSVNRADEKQTVIQMKGRHTTFSVIRLGLGSGGLTYNLTHNSGAQFGALLYGFGRYVSYSYSLGYEYNVLEGSRLVSGNGSKAGFLELLVGGTCTRACGGDIGLNEATVICRDQGYYRYPLRHDAVKYIQSTHSVTGYQPTIQCSGSESDVTQCRISSYTNACASGQVRIDCAPQLDEIVNVHCTASGWLVDIDMEKLTYRFPGSVETDIYMGDNSCRGKLVGSHLQLSYGIHSCLTSKSITNDNLVFTNELIYAYHDPSQPYIIRNYNWTLDISCLVPRNESTHNVVSYNQSTSVDATISPVGGYRMQMKLFTDPNFLNAISDGPIRVAVGSKVYVKMYIENVDWTIKMKLNSCYTTTSMSGSARWYYIIKNGCETDANTHIISEAAHETRFVFSVFEMSANHDGLFLNCDAVYCDKSDPASLSPCQQPCNLHATG